MAGVKAPLLSFEARGQIGKAQVYGSWKGIPYARRYVVPANPQSTEQTITRNAFSWLQAVFQLMPQLGQDPWDAFVQGKPLTSRNAFTQRNLPILRPLSALTGMQMSPGAKGGLPADFTSVGAAGQITLAVTAPTALPSGWSIVKAVGQAVRAQDPQSGVLYNTYAAQDLTAPYSVVITGLAAGAYLAAAWLVYQRSALATDLAYGPAVVKTATVT